MKRRGLGLLLFSALVSPYVSMAASCAIGNSDEIARSAGYRLATGAIKGAVYGGIAAAAVVGIGLSLGVTVTAGAALTVFSGVAITQGILPAFNGIRNDAVNFLEAGFGNIQ